MTLVGIVAVGNTFIYGLLDNSPSRDGYYPCWERPSSLGCPIRVGKG